MKFLVDAQLPKRFCTWMTAAGHDALHTLDLPKGNRTPDNEIIDLAEQEERVVITKDDDFVQSFLLSRRPPKLLLIATGNISNAELETMIQTNLSKIVEALVTSHFVEIGNNTMVIHE